MMLTPVSLPGLDAPDHDGLKEQLLPSRATTQQRQRDRASGAGHREASQYIDIDSAIRRGSRSFKARLDLLGECVVNGASSRWIIWHYNIAL